MRRDAVARQLWLADTAVGFRRRRRHAEARRRGVREGTASSSGGDTAGAEQLQAMLWRHQENLPEVEPREVEEREPERPVVTDEDLAARTPIAVTTRGRVLTRGYQPGL